MADGIGVTITGGDRLTAHLDAIVAHMQGEMESVVVVGALPILNAAKQNTPVKSGTLKRSEHVGGHVPESGDVDLKDWGEVSQPEKTADHTSVFIGTNCPYARSIEYGRSAGPSGMDSVMAKYGGAAAGGYGVARAMFRRAFDDPAVQAKASKQSELAYKLLLKQAVGAA